MRDLKTAIKMIEYFDLTFVESGAFPLRTCPVVTELEMH